MKRTTLAYIPSSHLDLFWLGSYKTCLERGTKVIKEYLDRCLETPDETFFLETVVFATYFLQKYPEYREKLVDLVHAGRVEVGSAYIDRFETMAPGESLIRNVLIGKRWCREVLGIESPTVTHPDLPSLTPQIPQIYHQLGVKYYVTSRKMYRHGHVWRFRAPDGSRLIMLNYPRHYIFTPLHASDMSPQVLKRMWVQPLDMVETVKGFPLGTVCVSGGAGDLTDRGTFHERYGQFLEEFVAAFKVKYPDYQFTYTIPSRVLTAYDNYPDLPEHSGEVPTVWGLGGGEDHRFNQRLYELEARLLTAESLVVIAEALNLPWRSPSADTWQGVFHEGAFFGCKDPIAPGQELAELWRMHIFTQDHNAAGQEGVLSSFQKAVLQERGLTYTQEIITFGLGQIARKLPGSGKVMMVFNPYGQTWGGCLQVTFPATLWDAGLRLVDETGAALPFQVIDWQGDTVELALVLPEIPSLGYRSFPLKESQPVQGASSIQITRDAGPLLLTSQSLEVDINLQTGSLTRIWDRQRRQGWGGEHVGRLYSIEESGNDVAMLIKPAAPIANETLLGVDVLDSGTLFTRVLIRKQFIRCQVEQVVTLWNQGTRLDLETRIFWWGKRNQQVCLGLSGAVSREMMTYGSAFYGTGWTEIMEGCGPWNSDEISPENQLSYREVLGWMHLSGRNGGLTICSHHPWYHHTPEGLEAVLMRTCRSCGDSRLYLEQPGEHVFSFTFLPGERDWRRANVQQRATQLLRKPVYSLAQTDGSGNLPVSGSFLKVEGDNFALSSLYPGQQPGTIIARVYETTGQPGKVRFSGPLAGGAAQAVNFLEEGKVLLEGVPGSWELEIPAWGIRTVLFTNKDSF